MASLPFLSDCLASRLPAAAAEWLRRNLDEVAGGLDTTDFCARLSMASRYLPRGGLSPTTAERERAASIDPGFEPERWTLVETGRVSLVLARSDLAEDAGAEAVEEAFRYADEGELCALYRSLAHLPNPRRFAWRGGEGCRTNMRTVFEAVACDTSYPARHFEDLPWRQAVVKCIFIEAPLWRIWGLDDRLDEELARMALDLADERRSARRRVQPELWLCLGTHGGRRAEQALELELHPDNPHLLGRVAATWATARAGRHERLRPLVDDADAPVRAAAEAGLTGPLSQSVFSQLEGLVQEAGGAS